MDKKTNCLRYCSCLLT